MTTTLPADAIDTGDEPLRASPLLEEEGAPFAPRYQPDNCPHCAYDRRFPETADGGWIYPGDNHALVPCGMCNPHGTFSRSK